MPRLLIRSGKDPFAAVGAETTLQQNLLNSNTGNQLFQLAVHRTLLTPDAEIVSNGTLSETAPATPGDVARINEHFDAFVVPMANAFRPEFVRRLENLTTLVRGLTIPTVVVGVGAQTAVDGDLEQLQAIAAPVRDFVAAVLERSASVGVRGELTAAYLRGLGFPEDAIDVIGCPSLFLHGPDFRLSDPPPWPGDDARVALNLTPGVPGLGDLCLAWTERHPRLEFVGQDHEDLSLVLWGEELRERADPGLPTHLDHPLVREGRVAFPLDLRPWLDHLRAADFAVGTRFHGNVAGVLADTPALLLAHDSRTLELAEHHGLPHRVADAVPAGTTLAALYEEYAPAGFNARYTETFAGYLGFLERNGLAHVYADGGDGAEFDKRLESVEFPPLVRPLPADLAPAVRDRLRWLRGGMLYDSLNHPEGYRHPFRHPAPKDPGTVLRREQRAAARRVEGQRQRIEAMKARSDRQAARLDRQQKRIEQHLARLDRQAGRLDALEEQVRVLTEGRRGPLSRLRGALSRRRGTP